jgi:hypothetical protein
VQQPPEMFTSSEQVFLHRLADRFSGDPTEVEEAANALRLSRSVKAEEGRPSTGVESDLHQVP